MPAILTAHRLIAKLTWGLDDNAIGSTAQHEEAARQLDYLKGSTSHWSPADTRLTQPVNGVSVLQARDRIRAKMREAVADGRASRRSKHQKALSDAAAVAEEQEAAAAASQRKNAHVLRAVAKLLEEKDRIARSAVVAQHNNLQLAKELGAGEPDEELLEGAEDTEPDQAVVAGSAEPPPKRRRATPAAAPPHVAQADRILKKAADLQEQKALMRAAKEAAERAGQSTKGAALRTLLRRLCKHSQTDARELEEQVDAWSAAAPSQTDGSKDEGRVADLLQPVDASKEPPSAATQEAPHDVEGSHDDLGALCTTSGLEWQNAPQSDSTLAPATRAVDVQHGPSSQAAAAANAQEKEAMCAPRQRVVEKT